MSEGFSIVAHPSDVGFRAAGPDWPATLDRAVAALACIITGDRAPEPTSERAVDLVGDDHELLVVQLLEECLYLVDTADWLATSARLTWAGERLSGVLLGAAMDEPSRAGGVHVKAITWHQLIAEEGPDGVLLQVFVDL